MEGRELLLGVGRTSTRAKVVQFSKYLGSRSSFDRWTEVMQGEDSINSKEKEKDGREKGKEEKESLWWGFNTCSSQGLASLPQRGAKVS